MVIVNVLIGMNVTNSADGGRSVNVSNSTNTPVINESGNNSNSS